MVKSRSQARWEETRDSPVLEEAPPSIAFTYTPAARYVTPDASPALNSFACLMSVVETEGQALERNAAGKILDFQEGNKA